jgi:CelD/BcsL family acetyltransferase involved in cellulose biosynthesis
MTAVDADGKLCASFNYGISPDGRSIVLMGVSTNPEFAKYSPGILLLFNFIENTITHNTYDFIDFTRGNESYKYALGGKEHIIKHFTITI